MSALLTVRDLRVRYPVARGWAARAGARPAFVDVLPGVSLEVARGETVAIVGESGSGKTTLAMALCGLAPVHGGEVVLDGRPVAPDRNRRLQPDRRRVALMFQDPVGSLSPRMTVRRILAEPFLIHKKGVGSNFSRFHAGGRIRSKQLDPTPFFGDADREALRLLRRVGLGETFADRYPHQLSGGQARRVGVARAIALNPDLLIADEPTAGLDVSIQGEVLNLLARLQREMGLGIVLITHNLNVVRHVADRMAIMYLGRFVEQGDARAIFDQPRHPYTAALLSANPSPDPEASRDRLELSGEVPSLLQRPAGCEFHTRCPRVRDRCRQSFPERSADGGNRFFRCFFPLRPE